MFRSRLAAGLITIGLAGISLAALPGRAANPATPGLQYDEITRIVAGSATAPPAGSFDQDYQTALSSAPKQHHGMFASVQNAMDQARSIMTGHITRYAYYNGWERIDDVAGQTATIAKCDQHQFITLDLAKKTYSIAPDCESVKTTAPAMSGPTSYAGTPKAEEPGTGDASITWNSTDLGPKDFDGIATTGHSSSGEFSMTNATGSCKNGDFKMSMENYISSIDIPKVKSMQAPPPMMGSFVAPSTSTSGGCRPHVSVHGSGAANYSAMSDRLVMYSVMSGGSQQGRGSIVTERGNVKFLSADDATALFSIPPDFSKAQ